MPLHRGDYRGLVTKVINLGGQAEGLRGSSSGNSSNSEGRRGSSSTRRGMGSSAGSNRGSCGKGSSSMSWTREGAQAEGAHLDEGGGHQDTDAPAGGGSSGGGSGGHRRRKLAHRSAKPPSRLSDRHLLAPHPLLAADSPARPARSAAGRNLRNRPKSSPT